MLIQFFIFYINILYQIKNIGFKNTNFKFFILPLELKSCTTITKNLKSIKQENKNIIPTASSHIENYINAVILKLSG